jgi:hypothetical protein
MVFKLNLPYSDRGGIDCLQGYVVQDAHGVDDPPQKHILIGYCPDSHVISPLEDNVHFPRERVDGWMEVELGEFPNNQGVGGTDVFISLTEEPQMTMVYVWIIDLRSKTLPPT